MGIHFCEDKKQKELKINKALHLTRYLYTMEIRIGVRWKSTFCVNFEAQQLKDQLTNMRNRNK